MGSHELDSGIGIARLLLKCHQLEKELATSAGFSVEEVHCLVQLYLHAPCCVKTLLEWLEVHPTRASRLLQSLEQKGFLTRSLGFDDKRKELVNLTPEGLRTAKTLLESSALLKPRLAGSIPEDVAGYSLVSKETIDDQSID